MGRTLTEQGVLWLVVLSLSACGGKAYEHGGPGRGDVDSSYTAPFDGGVDAPPDAIADVETDASRDSMTDTASDGPSDDPQLDAPLPIDAQDAWPTDGSPDEAYPVDAHDAFMDGSVDAPTDGSLDGAYPVDAQDAYIDTSTDGPLDGTSAMDATAESDGGQDASADVVFECTAGTRDCDGNASNGCEVNITSDVEHCGACASPCVAAAANSAAVCSGGVCAYACQPGFEDCDGYSDNGCETDSSIDTINCGGCGTNCGRAGCANGECLPPPQVLATGSSYPQHMAVDAANVYWSESPSHIFSCPKAGGPKTALTSGLYSPSELTTDGVNVYFYAGERLYKIPVTGGPATWLAPMEINHQMATDGTHVYYPQKGDIRRVAVNGGPSELVVSPGSMQLAMDQGWLFWLGGLPSSTIHGKLIAGGPEIPLAQVQVELYRFAAAGGHIVWSEFDSETYSSRLRLVPVTGGSPKTLLANPTLGELTMDSTRAYWVSYWGIISVLLDGGAHLGVAGHHNNVADIEVDETHVYWLENAYNGTISRAPKP